jgi:hypothetical protein
MSVKNSEGQGVMIYFRNVALITRRILMDKDWIILSQKTMILEYQRSFHLDTLTIIMYSLFVLSAILIIFLIGYYTGKTLWRDK